LSRGKPVSSRRETAHVAKKGPAIGCSGKRSRPVFEDLGEAVVGKAGIAVVQEFEGRFPVAGARGPDAVERRQHRAPI
jgi:hypothetical protein